MPNSLRSLWALNGRKFTEHFFLPGQHKSGDAAPVGGAGGVEAEGVGEDAVFGEG